MKIKKTVSAPCGALRGCEACPNTFCRLRARYTAENQFKIISDFDYNPKAASGIAIDIGTTTVAAVKYKNGNLIDKITELNAQRLWGADVLSRIAAANRGEDLTAPVNEQINRIIKRFDGEKDKTVIVANTAMTSLLMGWDCSGFGSYPFTAPDLDNVQEGHKTIIGAVSAFIGADIVSGLYMCGFDECDDVNMLIDLGTNGEMAIGNRKEILCTSAAAGPAFEGGGISCGTGSVDGAICALSIKEGKYEIIGEAEPFALCGTGLVELLYELRAAGYMTDDGLLSDRYNGGYYVTDKILFTQQDIRLLQTAKSAIRAGIEILIDEYGAADVKNIYIAGGFGKSLNIKKACAIGLLPERFIERYKPVGNSALGGAVKLLDHGCDCSKTDNIKQIASDFSLAEKDSFQDLFLKYINFI